MKRRKIWKLWEALSMQEREKFNRWLDVELEQKQTFVRKLSEALISYQEPPSLENLWKRLYPRQSYDDARLRKLLSELMKYLKIFLAIEVFKEDQLRVESYYLHGLNLKGLSELFEKEIRQEEKKLDKAKIKDGNTIYHRFSLLKERQRYFVKYLQGPNPANELTQAFDAWWIYNKLILACNNAIQYRMRGEPIQSTLLEETLVIVNEDPFFQDYHLIHVYSKIYQILMGNDIESESDENVKYVINFLKLHKESISYDGRSNIFKLLVSHFIGLRNKRSNPSITNKLFDLYLWGCKERFVFQDGILSWMTFKNIITVMLHKREYGMVEEYMDLLIPYLPEEDRIQASKFVQSALYFERKQFRDVIEEISHHRFTNPIYEIPARIYLLQSHYELGTNEDEWILGQLSSLDRYIATQDFSSYYKKGYLNRVRFFKKILSNFTQSAYDQIMQQLTKEAQIDNVFWLQEKLSDLMHKKGRK